MIIHKKADRQVYRQLSTIVLDSEVILSDCRGEVRFEMLVDCGEVKCRVVKMEERNRQSLWPHQFWYLCFDGVLDLKVA